MSVCACVCCGSPSRIGAVWGCQWLIRASLPMLAQPSHLLAMRWLHEGCSWFSLWQKTGQSCLCLLSADAPFSVGAPFSVLFAVQLHHPRCCVSSLLRTWPCMTLPAERMACFPGSGGTQLKAAETASIQIEDIADLQPLSAALSAADAQAAPPPDHPAEMAALAAVDQAAAADRAGQESSSAGPAGPRQAPSEQLSFSQDGPNLPEWAWQAPSLLWLSVALGEEIFPGCARTANCACVPKATRAAVCLSPFMHSSKVPTMRSGCLLPPVRTSLPGLPGESTGQCTGITAAALTALDFAHGLESHQGSRNTFLRQGPALGWCK